MQLVVVGLNIKSASVDALEALSIHHSDIPQRLQELITHPKVQAAVIISTCNRLEIYATSDDTAQGVATLRAHLGQGNSAAQANKEQPQNPNLDEVLYEYVGLEALQHLYRVVCGLDSLVMGETEILGQVARAYEIARNAKTTDKLLNVAFQRALALGKKVRTDVRMDQYHTSIGRIAVDLAKQELGGLAGKRILILGAGEMSELTMKHLASQTASVVMVSSRSLSKAQVLAAQYGFEACCMDRLSHYLAQADLVFSATSAKHYLITPAMLLDVLPQRQHRPLVFIDMAVPRDIDPQVGECADTRLLDIRQLHDVASNNQTQRERAALIVERYLQEEVGEFAQWMDSQGTRAHPLPRLRALKFPCDKAASNAQDIATAAFPGPGRESVAL